MNIDNFFTVYRTLKHSSATTNGPGSGLSAKHVWKSNVRKSVGFAVFSCALERIRTGDPVFRPYENSDSSVLRSHNLASVETSFVQTIYQTLQQIHSFVKNRYDEGWRMLSRQTKDVVVLASRHS